MGLKNKNNKKVNDRESATDFFQNQSVLGKIS